jgi:serine/threonine protein kinase
MKVFYTDLMDPKGKSRAEWEIFQVQKIHHPHIVQYLGHEIRSHQLFLFMEYLPQSLHGVIKSINSEKRSMFTEEEVATASISILLALRYLHTLQTKLIHRDLKVLIRNTTKYSKSKNILVEVVGEGLVVKKAKLCDFGVCTENGGKWNGDTVIGTTR